MLHHDPSSSVKPPHLYSLAMIWICIGTPSTQGNIEISRSYGNTIIEVTSRANGKATSCWERANGGTRRNNAGYWMFSLPSSRPCLNRSLVGRRVHHGTNRHEAIDPVRFIGNQLREWIKNGNRRCGLCKRGASVDRYWDHPLRLPHPEVCTMTTAF